MSKPQNKKDKKYSIFFIIFFFIIGAFVAWGPYLSIVRVHQSLLSRNWEKVEGVVMEHNILSSGRHALYTPVIDYCYSIENSRYCGSRISFLNEANNSYSRVQQKLAEYPLDSSVSVQYDPSDPSQSCLECEKMVNLNTLFSTILSFFLFWVAYSLFSGFKKK